jgi:hypothetical protein
LLPVRSDAPASVRRLPEIVAEALDHCDVTQLRGGANRAARMAIARVGLVDGRVDAALAALQSGRIGDGPARGALLRLVEQLDSSGSLSAHQTARACSALWSALDADPRVAAAGATYETHAVLGDWEPLIELWTWRSSHGGAML